MLFLISIIETVFFDKACIHLGKVGKESKKNKMLIHQISEPD